MWQKTEEELRIALSAPFPSADIDWRVSATTQDKSRGLAVPYVTNRAIQNRLDDTVGVDGWHNDFVPWKNDRAQLCGISIYFPDAQAWLTKWDGADDSDIESVKGGLSDSMKRAAVEWGIGRYLYGMTQVWVAIEPRGKGFVIRDSERPSLDAAHDRWVEIIQQRKATSQQGQPQGSQITQSGAVRQGNPRPAQDAIQHQAAPAVLPQQGAVPQQTQPSVQMPRNQGNTDIPARCYLVMGAVLKPTVSGGSRTSVQVKDSAGQVLQAFTRNADNRLAPGILLKNAQFSTQQSNGVTFYILETYQIMDFGNEQAA